MADINDNVSRAYEIIRRRFQQPDILWEGLQTAGSGISRIGNRNITRGNENLALYGDAVMAQVLCKQWYEQGESLGMS